MLGAWIVENRNAAISAQVKWRMGPTPTSTPFCLVKQSYLPAPE